MKRNIIALSFLIILNAYITPDTEASLIGYWDFNKGIGDMANDSSGFGNNATGLSSGWVPGKYGYGTTSDNIVVPPDASLLTSSSLTISAWVKIDEFNGLQRRILEMAPNYGFLFNPPNASLETPFLLTLNLDQRSFEFQKPQLGEWFYAAVTWDGTTARFYYNGVAITPIAFEKTLVLDNSVSLFMGAPGYTLDEVRFYNEVLSPHEITRDMNFDSTIIPEPATLILLAGGLTGAFLRREKRISSGDVGLAPIKWTPRNQWV